MNRIILLACFGQNNKILTRIEIQKVNENEEKEFEDCIPITKKEAVEELSFIFEKVKWERYVKAEIFRKEDVLETLFYTEDQNYISKLV